jgi:uncharacterized integral membrane protein (TIGR00697 family)
METTEKDLKLFSIFTGIFVATLIISNVAAAGKILMIGPLTVAGGIVIFPVSYIFGDILTEVYGYHRSRKVIWTGFGCVLLAALSFWLVQQLPPAPFWNNQAAYDSILGFVPRIFLASLTAYFMGEFANSYVMSKMKYFAKGARGTKQAWRFVASTMVGEGVDTAVFTLLAFYGVIPPAAMISVMLGGYILKVAYEIIATPFTVRFSNWVKKVEGIDQIDIPAETDYSPLAVFKGPTTPTAA